MVVAACLFATILGEVQSIYTTVYKKNQDIEDQLQSITNFLSINKSIPPPHTHTKHILYISPKAFFVCLNLRACDLITQDYHTYHPLLPCITDAYNTIMAWYRGCRIPTILQRRVRTWLRMRFLQDKAIDNVRSESEGPGSFY